MPSTGWLSPSTGSSLIAPELGGSAANIAWNNPANITASNDVYATCTLASLESSRMLSADSFSIPSLPAGAVISSISVRVEVSRSGLTSNFSSTALYGATFYSPTVSTQQNNAIGTTDAYLTFTFTPAEWGLPNNTTLPLGCGYFCAAGSFASGTVSVDHIQMQIDYTLPRVPQAIILI